MRWRICAVLTLSLLMICPLLQADQVHALYGLPLSSPPFAGRTPAQVAAMLRADGVNAVVRCPLNRTLIQALHNERILAIAEFALFHDTKRWPRCRPILADGSPMGKDGWYRGVCPCCPDLVDQAVAKADRIARNYAVDGLWLDFIRWPSRWEGEAPNLQETCFCANCLQRFQQDTGISLPQACATTQSKAAWIKQHHAPAWYAWRCDVIREVIRRIRQAVHSHRPKALIGIFCVPCTDAACRRLFGQDPARLSTVVDVFSPMGYHLLCYKDSEWIKRVNRFFQSATSRPLWPIIQSVDQPRPMDAREFRRALAAGLHGTAGIMVFKTSATVKTGKWNQQREVFLDQADQHE